MPCEVDGWDAWEVVKELVILLMNWVIDACLMNQHVDGC